MAAYTLQARLLRTRHNQLIACLCLVCQPAASTLQSMVCQVLASRAGYSHATAGLHISCVVKSYLAYVVFTKLLIFTRTLLALQQRLSPAGQLYPDPAACTGQPGCQHTSMSSQLYYPIAFWDSALLEL